MIVQNTDSYLYRERRNGSYYRALRFPETVDYKNVSSTLQNGVLTITLPKLESKKARNLSYIKQLESPTEFRAREPKQRFRQWQAHHSPSMKRYSEYLNQPRHVQCPIFLELDSTQLRPNISSSDPVTIASGVFHPIPGSNRRSTSR